MPLEIAVYASSYNVLFKLESAHLSLNYIVTLTYLCFKVQ